MGKRDWSKSFSKFLLIVLFASVAINASQARKIRSLVDSPISGRSRVGEVATPIIGVGRDGQPVSIDFIGGQATVLYFFSPTCESCERNWDSVKALAHASEGKFRLIGITAKSDFATFAQQRGLDFELVGSISASAQAAFGLGGTPQTLVVSSQGRISHEWIGTFDGRRKQAIERFFEVELPGVRPATDTPERR